MKDDIRVMPMYKPLPVWDQHSHSKYPDALKMAFRDGKVKIYRLEVEQPKPHIFSEYVGKHAKK